MNQRKGEESTDHDRRHSSYRVVRAPMRRAPRLSERRAMRRPAFFVFGDRRPYPNRRMARHPFCADAEGTRFRREPIHGAAATPHRMSTSASTAEIRWLPLGMLLTGAGLLTEEELAQAIDAQTHRGGRLGTVVIELGLLNARQIAGAIAEQCHLEFLDLDHTSVDPA